MYNKKPTISLIYTKGCDRTFHITLQKNVQYYTILASILEKLGGLSARDKQQLLTLHPKSAPQSQLKPPEPTSLVVQLVEDGSGHQPVNTVQHHSKTQANSLSTPPGLFLVLSTDPREDRATVKGGRDCKNRPHTGHSKMVGMNRGGH